MTDSEICIIETVREHAKFYFPFVSLSKTLSKIEKENKNEKTEHQGSSINHSNNQSTNKKHTQTSTSMTTH